MARVRPDISDDDLRMARAMLRKANRGWYTGDGQSLVRFAQYRDLIARTEPELGIRLPFLRRDEEIEAVRVLGLARAYRRLGGAGD